MNGVTDTRSQIPKSWANAEAVADWKRRKQTLQGQVKSAHQSLRKRLRTDSQSSSSIITSSPTPRRNSRRRIVDFSSSTETPDCAVTLHHDDDNPSILEIDESPLALGTPRDSFPLQVLVSQHSSFPRDRYPAHLYSVPSKGSPISARDLSSGLRVPLISPGSSPPTRSGLTGTIPDSQSLPLSSSGPGANRANKRPKLSQKFVENRNIQRSPQIAYSDRSSNPTTAVRNSHIYRPKSTAASHFKSPQVSLNHPHQTYKGSQNAEFIDSPASSSLVHRSRGSEQVDGTGKRVSSKQSPSQNLTLQSRSNSGNTRETSENPFQPLGRSSHSPGSHRNCVETPGDTSPNFQTQLPPIKHQSLDSTTWTYTQFSTGKREELRNPCKIRRLKG